MFKPRYCKHRVQDEDFHLLIHKREYEFEHIQGRIEAFVSSYPETKSIPDVNCTFVVHTADFVGLRRYTSVKMEK